MNLAVALSSALLACAGRARADEGMWLLSKPPTKVLSEKYGFSPAAAFLEHVQKAAVRFETGGSGSVVSADGLVMTNHHVGSDMLLKLSTPERNLLETGFLAAERAQELRCPDLEVSILWEVEDVTAKVAGALKEGLSVAESGKARREAIAGIEKASKDSTGLKSEVVTLYGGAQYHLYRYRSYTDVRLVFAPEEAIAFYGGDNDNFEFPRFDLDCCFFRIYENGRPIKAEHFLAWSPGGAKENDLALVVGHPGHTERLNTYDHLRISRDIELPRRLQGYWRREIKAQNFCARSAENNRIGREELFGVANARKAYTGQLEGLLDPALMTRKKADEDQLRARVNADAGMKGRWAGAWDDVATVKKGEQAFIERKQLLDRVLGSSLLMNHAHTLVRLAAELQKPSERRLHEYSDAQLDSLYLSLYSPEPIYDSLEIFTIAEALTVAAERLGAEDPLVLAMLGGQSPRERAEDLVRGCTLKDPEKRRALAGGGQDALARASDAMIRFAQQVDSESRALRTRYEDGVEAPLRDAYAKIAAAQFAVRGESVYPDATFTLRLAFGPIKGYTDADGTVPAFTDFAGLYERAKERHGQEGFALPQRWVDARERLKLDTPFNFICTADIIGGNSGSPVVNTKGEVIGLIFDGNLGSLVGNYVYNELTGRAVAVDSRAIIEALRTVYAADSLVSEMTRSLASPSASPGH